MLSVAVISATVVLAGGPKRASAIDPALMADIRAVKTFQDEDLGEAPDPAMARIRDRGCSVHPALFQIVETNEPLPGVTIPLFGVQATTGHIAVIALVRWVGWQEAMDEATGKDEWKKNGMFAYYALAETAKGRKRVRAALEKHITCRTVQYAAPTEEP